MEDKTPVVDAAVEEEILGQAGSAAEAALETQRCLAPHRMP